MRTCTRLVRRSSRARNVSTFSTKSGIRITSIRIVPEAIFGGAAGARATLTPRAASGRTTIRDSYARLITDCLVFYVRLFWTVVLAKVGQVNGTPTAHILMTTAATSINDALMR